MVDAAIEKELSTCLGRLPVESQQQVLEFARMLERPPPWGVAGSALLKFAGTIPESDFEAMTEAIENGCERIDADEW